MNQNLFQNFKKEPRVLVTGGAGFIGNAVIRKLLKESSCHIFNLDKISYASDLSSLENDLKNEKNKSRYHLLKVNLYNSSDIDSAINHSDPDLVMHLAAESHVDRSIDGPRVFMESNIIGTYNLLESVRSHYNKLESKRKELFRFLHISTDEVYGSLGNIGSFNESTKYDPRSPYSASKASSDHIVNAWHHTFEIPTLITNCSNNYGPWQHREKLIPKIIFNATTNTKIPIYGDGKNIRDWLFVEDHVDGLLKVLNNGKIGQKYCIGGNQERSNNVIVNKICEILDKINPKHYSHKELITYIKDRPGHDKRYAIDSSKIRAQLGWKPKYTLDEGLKITIDWYLNKFKNYNKETF